MKKASSSFLDTNILVYAVAEHDPRLDIASSIVAEGGTISVQVLNEFANVLSRKWKWSWPDITMAVSNVLTLCAPPVPLTVAVHDRALALATRGSFSFYDALIIAAALEAGCTTLLSEDMQDGQVIEQKLTIRNPFRTS